MCTAKGQKVSEGANVQYTVVTTRCKKWQSLFHVGRKKRLFTCVKGSEADVLTSGHFAK